MPIRYVLISFYRQVSNIFLHIKFNNLLSFDRNGYKHMRDNDYGHEILRGVCGHKNWISFNKNSN